MESLWIVLRGGCLHFEGGGGFGGRTCWTQARRHHLGGERHTLPGGDPRGGPQSEFLLSFSESETFPRSRITRNQHCNSNSIVNTKFFFFFSFSLLENIHLCEEICFCFDFIHFCLFVLFAFKLRNYFWSQFGHFTVEKTFWSLF